MDLFFVVLFTGCMALLVTLVEKKKSCNPFHSWSTEFGTDTMVCIDCGEIVHE